MSRTAGDRPEGQKNWYNWAIWRRLRTAQLIKEPLCRMCKHESRTTAATVVDHIRAHRWNWALFINPLNLQSLCKRHHDSDKQMIDKGFNPPAPVDDDGWPQTPTVPRRRN